MSTGKRKMKRFWPLERKWGLGTGSSSKDDATFVVASAIKQTNVPATITEITVVSILQGDSVDDVSNAANLATWLRIVKSTANRICLSERQ